MQYTPFTRVLTALFLLTAVAVLSACGGGGGGGGSAGNASNGNNGNTTTVVPPILVPTSFQSVSPKPGFDWSTARRVGSVITLNRGSAALGPAALFVSSYSCVDLNDGTTPLTSPQGLDQFASYTLGTAEQALTSLRIDLSVLALQLPATQKLVLVELVSGGQTLYSQLLAPAALGNLQITLGATAVAPAVCIP